MVATAQRRTWRWTWLLIGWGLVAVGVALHAAAAATTAAVDPLVDVVTSAVQHGWVRAAAWAAVTGGAFLVVTGWSRRPSEPVDLEES
ncbi:hypothetical protein FHN55_06940 [Streptomyces sp. NP160]|uniref:hypothetical protein n=1 Tax=Streptomyces sp. NP160 TaxID=2586637 RepID=UPI00111813B4|nr:hypothetical protein [Streptomyces sp. NP160]TNM68525.1 hypothetical protein FHN55_06940 [Streptomyces sp. NP160]